MLHAVYAGVALFLLMALELNHRRQHRPGSTIDQAKMSTPPRQAGFKSKPGFGYAVGLRGLALEGKVPGLNVV
ncbi:MAG: hypothetical protein EBW58_08055 [Betaproteobacteria bacterium]|nr:hypothetical protein [Betaproteobacteria bacterium]